jgi:hypothetical protein
MYHLTDLYDYRFHINTPKSPLFLQICFLNCTTQTAQLKLYNTDCTIKMSTSIITNNPSVPSVDDVKGYNTSELENYLRGKD